MDKDLLLAIDVGTGTVRAALITIAGETLAFSTKEHDQIVPYFGWSEQKPLEWWEGAVTDIRSVLQKVDSATHRIAGVAACGQMHATVLIDEEYWDAFSALGS
jgi:xylulokinase